MKVRTAFSHIWFGSANRVGSGQVRGGDRDLTIKWYQSHGLGGSANDF